MLLCAQRYPAAFVSKILSMARLTCGMVVVPKLWASIYAKPSLWRGALSYDAPLLINMVTQGGKTSYAPTGEPERMGYDIIIFASSVQRAVIFGMRRLL